MNHYSKESKQVLKIILFFNIVVLVLEIIAGVISQSLSILGDAAHSTSDMLNNIVGLVILKFASEPPDKKHPYGHGKFETLAAFGIVTFLAIACLELLKGSIDRLIHPIELPLFSPLVVFFLIITLIINIFVWFYERKKGKELNSDLLLADSAHTGSDVLIRLVVLGSQFFIANKMYWVDPILAIFIGLIIAKAAHEIVMSTVPVLVDEVWLEPKKVIDSVVSVEGVSECYEVYSRRSPGISFIECNIKVIPKDLYNAHKVADAVEEKLKKDFGDCKIMIHVEP